MTEKKLSTETNEDITKLYNLGGIFSEKELKAILVGLDNDKEKYNQILKNLMCIIHMWIQLKPNIKWI